MVTILKPRESVPETVQVESAPAPETLQPRPESREWCYSMPFAGVRYFSFRPAPRPAAPVPEPETIHPVLSAKLIDERVMPL